jgi:NADPH:quinone reductase
MRPSSGSYPARADRVHGLVITAFGGPPRLARDLLCPDPGTGLTVVRVAAAALGHLDLTVASGRFRHRPALPYVPCGDGAGWVEESAVYPRGTLAWLRGGGLGVTRGGTASQYVAVPDEAVHPAPDGTDPVLAACFFSPATSAYLAVHELGGVTAAQQVLVTGGAGAVGSLVGGAGLPARLEAVRPGGTAVIVGYTAGTSVTLDLPARCAHDVDLRFLNMIRRAPQAFTLAGGLLAQLTAGRLTLRIDRYPIRRAEQGWTALAQGRAAGRVVLEVE